MSVAVGTTTAQSPRNKNFGGLKSYVAAYVQGQNLSGVLSDAGMAVNSAIDYLNTTRWNFLHSSETLTLTASTASYTVAADLKRPLKLYRLNSSSERQGQINFKEHGVFFDELHSQTGDGFPTYYTIPSSASRTLILDRAPDAAFVSQYPTLELRYYARILHFGSDGDTIGDLKAPPEVWTFLAWYARWDLACTRGSASQVTVAERHWNRLYDKLRADNFDTLTDWDL